MKKRAHSSRSTPNGKPATRTGPPAHTDFWQAPTNEQRVEAAAMLDEWAELHARYLEAAEVWQTAVDALDKGLKDDTKRAKAEFMRDVAAEYIDVVDIALGTRPAPVSLTSPKAAVERVATERGRPRAVGMLELVVRLLEKEQFRFMHLPAEVRAQARAALWPWAPEGADTARFDAAIAEATATHEFEHLCLKKGKAEAACWLLGHAWDQDASTVRKLRTSARNTVKVQTKLRVSETPPGTPEEH